MVSEIAWMGTMADGNDEWVELFNTGDFEIDLTGWTLTTKDGTPSILLSGVIAANSFFLLERTDDTTISDISADQIYTGALGNAGEVLILSDVEGGEIDRVDRWYAGDNTAKTSMERVDPTVTGTDSENWADNDGTQISGLDADGNLLAATPRFQNSVFPVVDPFPENSLPEIPTELSPTGFTNSKIFSAKYFDPEEEIGWVEFRVFSASPSDCSSDENLIVADDSAQVGSGANAEKEFSEIEDNEYFFCARANDGELSSEFSAVQNFTFDTISPSVFVDPPLGEFTESFEFALVVDESATIFFTTDGSAPDENSSIFNENFPVGTSITLQFFAVDSAGNSSATQSAEYFFENPDTAPSADVTDFVASAGNAAIDLNWTPPDSADLSGFKIYLDNTFLIALENSVTNFTIPALENEREYSIKITTLDFVENESTGMVTTATPQGIFTVAGFGEVIFSEIAWAGSSISASDEWIELRNISDKTFDLTGWKIENAATGRTDFEILGGMIAPDEFFLIGNNSATHNFVTGESVLATEPDFIDSSLSLSNSEFMISLRDSGGNLIDSVGGGGAPSSGASGEIPASMLRIYRTANWRTATNATNFDSGVPDFGNPKFTNFSEYDLAISGISASSDSPLPDELVEFTAIVENCGLSSAENFDLIWKINNSEVARESVENLMSFNFLEKSFSQNFTAGEFEISAEIEFSVDQNYANNSVSKILSVTNHLVINEFLPDPAGADSINEWIELFNPTDTSIQLDAFELNGAKISGEIAAGEFRTFTAETSGWDALPNSAGEILLRNSADEIIDSKSYSETIEKKSFGRDSQNLANWVEFWHPTKNIKNIFPEKNSNPIAVITIQGSGNSSGECSLFVNLTAENSTDPDNDVLEFEWDFGSSETSNEANPSGFYFQPGNYEVVLTVTDSLGASAEITQIFTIFNCSGKSSSMPTVDSDEPIFDSISVERVELKITEVSFNSDVDWIEIFVANDGNSGNGIELGGFYFEADKRIKTIPRGTKLCTGEFLVLEFKSETPDKIESGEGFTKIFSVQSGLTATDEQVTIRDSSGKIEDAVVWENRNGKWSRGEEIDILEIVDSDEWISTEFINAIDSSAVEREVAIVRFFDSAKTEFSDENSESDWFTTIFSTPGKINSSPLVHADEFDFQISAVSPKNPTGDFIRISCADCAESVALAGFTLRNGLDDIIFTFPSDAEISNIAPLEIIFSAEESMFENGIYYSEFHGLVGSDDLISLCDSENSVADFVGWSDRAVSPIRKEFDLSLLQFDQLEKRFTDDDWDSAMPESLLDSRELSHGSLFVRRNAVDTNSAEDFEICLPETPLDEIATTTGILRVSEIFPNPVGVDSGNEWFELVNFGDVPVELFGWNVGIEDSFFEFEESLILAPGEFRVFRGLLSIRNSASKFFLLDSDGELIDLLEYPEIKEGNSFAKSSSGEFAETAIPTPNCENIFFRILAPDVDTDGDGLSNSAENGFQTDPENFDTDTDGLPDLFEIQNNSNPLVADASSEKLQKYRVVLAMIGNSQFESIAWGNGVFLAGVGVPGGRMRIYIQSELQILEVPIDENGNWSYSLDREFKSGEHHIFIQLVDPRGVEGVAQKVLNFYLTQNFAPPVFTESVRISEILVNPTGDDSENEFIELENFSSEKVDISNFTLSVGRKKFSFPENSEIPAGGFLILLRTESSLVLKNSGGAIALAWPTGRVISEISFEKMDEGVAFALANSQFHTTENPTPGLANSILISLKKSFKNVQKNKNGNLSNSIRISEILANPINDDSKSEFIELENFGSVPVNLGNWQISDNQKTFTIADSTILQPGEFKIFPRSLTKLILNNAGREKIQLADFSGKIIDLFNFESPAEGVVLAFDSTEIRTTKIMTPNLKNEFDTEKISGMIEFRGDDGFVVQTENGETFVRFSEDDSALLARALFRDGGEYEIFVESENGEPIIVGFDISPEFLQTDFLALDFQNSKPQNSNWIFALIVFTTIFFGFRFAKMDEVWIPTCLSDSSSSRSRH